MSEYFDDMREFWSEGKEHRQRLGASRIHQFKEHIKETEITSETDWSIRFLIRGKTFDFYPQKCRLFDICRQKWYTLNRKHFISHIRKLTGLTNDTP